MRFTSLAAILRIAFVGFICAASLANALPAAPTPSTEANPTSLLGRSYTRHAADTSILLISRRLASDSQIQQLDYRRPLGRVERFQIAQRRSENRPGSSGAVEDKSASQRVPADLEAREILLSHQMAPSVPSITTSLSSSSNIPATLPATTSISLSTPPSPAATPGSHARKAKPKTKKTKHSERKKAVAAAPAQVTGE
ncbi:hypothetical protein C8F04DRAFT_1252461 [Mycena alexandri]|uniref:Uncharacterized protein n=1 Tax=Mycena alexandri TaxID=1745969 RepID=A0AAD6T911_9AGAR|nr:hypothetical protein C8F04DRAFT_1252461 [Mycena alexandri]